MEIKFQGHIEKEFSDNLFKHGHDFVKNLEVL